MNVYPEAVVPSHYVADKGGKIRTWSKGEILTRELMEIIPEWMVSVFINTVEVHALLFDKDLEIEVDNNKMLTRLWQAPSGFVPSSVPSMPIQPDNTLFSNTEKFEIIPPPITGLDEVLAERKSTHGDYREHAQITQELKRIMETKSGWAKLDDAQRETLAMTAHKIGRILAGNPNEPDHWRDIAGYNQLIVKILTGDMDNV